MCHEREHALHVCRDRESLRESPGDARSIEEMSLCAHMYTTQRGVECAFSKAKVSLLLCAVSVRRDIELYV